ncbi:MAG TPA: hypothetical protein VIQ62_10370 [Burkholderiales bacterium]|jgi:hypothetical protein
MIVARRELVAGRIVLGPRNVKGQYARIVSQSDGSGRVETFDTVTQKWRPAPEDVSFSDIWAAPIVSPLAPEIPREVAPHK